MITRIESTQPKDSLDIRWEINNVCNFKCRYCFPDSNRGNNTSPTDLSLTIDNFNFMLDRYEQELGKKTFHLKLLGGEPTLWKELSQFIEGIKSKHNVYVSLVTNGSRTLRWWKENSHLFDNLILSFHQQESDIDHMIAIADFAYECGKKVTVHILMDDKHWDACIDSIAYMKKHSKYSWMIQTKEIITTAYNIVEYTGTQRIYMQREMKRYPTIWWLLKNYKLVLGGIIRKYESVYYNEEDCMIDASPQHYITTSQNNFKNWKCDIGIESIFISATGKLMGSCGQQFFGNLNILSPDFRSKFKIDLSPTICEQDICPCPPETHISKSNLQPIHFRK